MPALEALNEISQIVGVVCQPDRPAGRGRKLRAPPVKQAALNLNLVVHQPVKVKTGTLHEWLASLAVDMAVVMAYGRILPRSVLDAPRLGCVNLHASLLPKYRGAAPINWCLVQGETETGISLMQMDEGMDTGPVFSRHPLPIAADDDAGTLSDKLAQLAAHVVRADVSRIVGGELPARPQNETAATHAPLIEKEHTIIDWSRPSRMLVNLVRGMSPQPGARTTLRGQSLKVLRLGLSPEEPTTAHPGTICVVPDRRIMITCGDGMVELLRAQPAGRNPQSARDLLNGRALATGDVLGTQS